MAADGMLKLMLILLAFFVYLHGQSMPSDERAGPVLHSLAARFAGLPTTSGSDDAGPAGEALDWPGDLRRRLIGHLPVTASSLSAPGVLLGFDLAAANLFDLRDDSVLRDRRVLLHRLAEAIETSAADRRLILVITTTSATGSVDLVADPVMTKRLAAMADVLATAGLSPPRLRLGLAPLPADVWRFAIRVDASHAG